MKRRVVGQNSRRVQNLAARLGITPGQAAALNCRRLLDTQSQLYAAESAIQKLRRLGRYRTHGVAEVIAAVQAANPGGISAR